MKKDGLLWFVETLHEARRQNRDDLKRARAKVDALAERDVELTAKIESMEQVLQKRGAA